jgi:hypothetical protein
VAALSRGITSLVAQEMAAAHRMVSVCPGCPLVAQSSSRASPL